jgi:hypothetical protein
MSILYSNTGPGTSIERYVISMGGLGLRIFLEPALGREFAWIWVDGGVKEDVANCHTDRSLHLR